VSLPAKNIMSKEREDDTGVAKAVCRCREDEEAHATLQTQSIYKELRGHVQAVLQNQRQRPDKELRQDDPNMGSALRKRATNTGESASLGDTRSPYVLTSRIRLRYIFCLFAIDLLA